METFESERSEVATTRRSCNDTLARNAYGISCARLAPVVYDARARELAVEIAISMATCEARRGMAAKIAEELVGPYHSPTVSEKVCVRVQFASARTTSIPLEDPRAGSEQKAHCVLALALTIA